MIETPLLKVSRSNSSIILEDREVERSPLFPGLFRSEIGTAGGRASGRTAFSLEPPTLFSQFPVLSPLGYVSPTPGAWSG